MSRRMTSLESRRLFGSVYFMPYSPNRLRKTAWLVLIAFAMITGGSSQIPFFPTSSGPAAPPGFKKELDQFNADVAAWNKRCRITRSEAEDAWCKKERARIDARRAELKASGAVQR